MLLDSGYFAHDLKNRLTVARGFVHLIKSGRVKGKPEKQEEYLEIIDDALRDAMTLLDEHDVVAERRIP